MLIILQSGIFGQTATPGTAINSENSGNRSISKAIASPDSMNSTIEKYSYELRKPPREKIKKYLDDDELNYIQYPDIEKNWIERIYDWINRQVESLFQSKGYSVFVDYLIYIIMFAALIIIISGLLKSDLRGLFYGTKNKSLSGFAEQTEDIGNIDFEKLIIEALAKNNYKVAVRYHYLKILLILSKLNLIELKEFKTSRQFVSEIKNPEKYLISFKSITSVFEKVWYGNYVLEEISYKSVEEGFKNFEKLTGII